MLLILSNAMERVAVKPIHPMAAGPAYCTAQRENIERLQTHTHFSPPVQDGHRVAPTARKAEILQSKKQPCKKLEISTSHGWRKIREKSRKRTERQRNTVTCGGWRER